MTDLQTIPRLQPNTTLPPMAGHFHRAGDRFAPSQGPGSATSQTTEVVIGVASSLLACGLEALVRSGPPLRLHGTAHALDAFVHACAQAGDCLALADAAIAHGDVQLLLKTLAGTAPQARVVLMTEEGQPHRLREALRCGAFGLLSPSAGVDEIRLALATVAAGRRHIPPHVAVQLAESLTVEDLTARESEVLGLLALGRCNKSIARELDISVGTVKTHVSAIMDKLDARRRTEVVLRASRLGLVRIA